ncbi:crocetin glucosyltransferase chloroplastic [Prunus yedoensis var. nudiflora]|uniref:Crocetin glucosyltransferase chloroplastic n=1 Tax=Prunus yedoensis var. nudiflora TaxID=2094558 RepID=A0A314ZJX8_PRUYE|nr:crocetin glucosyltransferase chloroplastic [Prunus yedoensis var. nudiflora]
MYIIFRPKQFHFIHLSPHTSTQYCLRPKEKKTKNPQYCPNNSTLCRAPPLLNNRHGATPVPPRDISGPRPYNPSLQLAKHLVRTTGAHVTYVTSLSAHRRIGNGSTPHGITYSLFSDGYDNGFKVGDDVDHYMSELSRCGAQAITDLIVSSVKEGRPYTCLIYTILLPWAAVAARELHLPSVLVWIQPATNYQDCHYPCQP